MITIMTVVMTRADFKRFGSLTDVVAGSSRRPPLPARGEGRVGGKHNRGGWHNPGHRAAGKGRNS